MRYLSVAASTAVLVITPCKLELAGCFILLLYISTGFTLYAMQYKRQKTLPQHTCKRYSFLLIQKTSVTRKAYAFACI